MREKEKKRPYTVYLTFFFPPNPLLRSLPTLLKKASAGSAPGTEASMALELLRIVVSGRSAGAARARLHLAAPDALWSRQGEQQAGWWRQHRRLACDDPLLSQEEQVGGGGGATGAWDEIRLVVVGAYKRT